MGSYTRVTVRWIIRHRPVIYATAFVYLSGLLLFFLLRPVSKPLDSSYLSLTDGESVTVTNYHIIQRREAGGYSFSDFGYGARYYIYVNLNDSEKLYVLCEVSDNSLRRFEEEPKQFERKIVLVDQEGTDHLKEEFDKVADNGEEDIRIAPFVITVK